MAGISKYEGKDRRRQRLRNHIAKDLKSDKYRQQIIPNRRRKYINEEDDEFFFVETRYDDSE